MKKIHKPVSSIQDAVFGGYYFRAACGECVRIRVRRKAVESGLADEALRSLWRSAGPDRRCKKCAKH